MHPDDDLIGILGRQLDDRRADHRGLRSRVVKVDAVGTGAGAHAVHATEEVVRVAVRKQRRMLVTPRSTNDTSSRSSSPRCSACADCQPWPASSWIFQTRLGNIVMTSVTSIQRLSCWITPTPAAHQICVAPRTERGAAFDEVHVAGVDRVQAIA